MRHSTSIGPPSSRHLLRPATCSLQRSLRAPPPSIGRISHCPITCALLVAGRSSIQAQPAALCLPRTAILSSAYSPSRTHHLLCPMKGSSMSSNRAAISSNSIGSGSSKNAEDQDSGSSAGTQSSGGVHSNAGLANSNGSSGEGGNPGAVPPQKRGLQVATLLVHPKSSVQDPYEASSTPLWQTSTFAQPSATTFGPYDYTRSGNPTRTVLEEQVAALEGADKAYAFTSGMAAISVVTRLVKAGQHIVTGDDIYGGTSRLLANIVPDCGISVSNVDMTDLEAVRAALQPGVTALLLIETPTNPRLQVADIAALAKLGHEAGAIVCVDNSIMAMFQRPLDLGADICMTSGTKFLGGHGDVTMGLLAVKGEALAKRIYYLQNAEGAGLAPFDCWLGLRGMKTMALRMERSAANCAALAKYLSTHPAVKHVNYAGLPTHPGAELHARQATSGGSLLSFETGNIEMSKVIVEATKLFKVTVSFGNVNSLISLPCYMSHASIPAEVRAARGLPDDLVRISTGIEDVDDLLADLDQAMNLAMDKVGMRHPPAKTTASSSQHSGSSSSQVPKHTPTVHVAHTSSDSAGDTSGNGHINSNGEQLTQRERQQAARIAELEAEIARLKAVPAAVGGAQ